MADVILIWESMAIEFRAIMTAKIDSIQCHFILLDPPLETTLGQRGDRVPDDTVRRLNHKLHQQGLTSPGRSARIDNQQQTPAETRDAILKIVADNQSLV